MEKQISNHWYLVLIKGIILIILAILLFMSPADALLSLILYIGIGFIIIGIIRVFQGISANNAINSWRWIVFEGAMDFFLGYILLAHPGLTLTVLPVLIGFWGVFYGLFLIIESFSGNGGVFLKIISGILLIILSNIIIFNSLSFGLTMSVWLGFILFFAGIYNIINSFSLKR
jgi:hypothetical protein